MPDEPTCCPDAYYCYESRDWECRRHGGFTICCQSMPHRVQSRASWHRKMAVYEQMLLNAFLREPDAFFKNMNAAA